MSRRCFPLGMFRSEEETRKRQCFPFQAFSVFGQIRFQSKFKSVPDSGLHWRNNSNLKMFRNLNAKDLFPALFQNRFSLFSFLYSFHNQQSICLDQAIV